MAYSGELEAWRGRLIKRCSLADAFPSHAGAESTEPPTVDLLLLAAQIPGGRIRAGDETILLGTPSPPTGMSRETNERSLTYMPALGLLVAEVLTRKQLVLEARPSRPAKALGPVLEAELQGRAITGSSPILQNIRHIPLPREPRHASVQYERTVRSSTRSPFDPPPFLHGR